MGTVTGVTDFHRHGEGGAPPGHHRWWGGATAPFFLRAAKWVGHQIGHHHPMSGATTTMSGVPVLVKLAIGVTIGGHRHP
jgi:hypothetical protein